MDSSKVYYASMHIDISDSVPNKLVRLVRAAGIADLECEGKLVAMKTHFGEYGNVTYLKPAFLRTVAAEVRALGGLPFATDCNTLYPGKRSNSVNHLACAAENGFSYRSCGCDVIIADGLRGGDEVALPTRPGSTLPEALIGRAIVEADAMVTITHAKGCLASSYGGAIKNIGMGCASRAGKMIMHSKGKAGVKEALCIGCGRCIEGCGQDAITIVDGKAHISDRCAGCGHCVAYCPRAALGAGEASWNDMQLKMAEYAGAVTAALPCFHIVIAIDVTPQCDCFAGCDSPMVPNVGMFASWDPVALDQAVADAICAQPIVEGGFLDGREEGLRDHFHAVNPDTDWRLCVEHAERIGMGTRSYELVEVR